MLSWIIQQHTVGKEKTGLMTTPGIVVVLPGIGREIEIYRLAEGGTV